MDVCNAACVPFSCVHMLPDAPDAYGTVSSVLP